MQDLDDPYQLDPSAINGSNDDGIVIPAEVQDYINRQFQYGFIYHWDPNPYYGSDDDDFVGTFHPEYLGLRDKIQDASNGQTILIYDYVFEMRPNYQPVELIHNQYQLIRELGRGAFGITYLGLDTVNNRQVAVKIIDLTKLKSRGYSQQLVANEIEALSELSHNGVSDYIVKYYASFEEVHHGVNSMIIISEYIDGINLLDYIRRAEIEPTVMWPLYLQLLLGLNGIHQRGYVHRDIKPDNIMLTSDHKIKYIDFWLACMQECKIDACINNCGGAHGAVAYTPEEIINGTRPLTFDAFRSQDIWALSLTMYQMANRGRMPDEIFSHYDLDRDGRTNDFLQQLIVKDWHHRPSVSDAIHLLTNIILQRVWTSTPTH